MGFIIWFNSLFNGGKSTPEILNEKALKYELGPKPKIAKSTRKTAKPATKSTTKKATEALAKSPAKAATKPAAKRAPAKTARKAVATA